MQNNIGNVLLQTEGDTSNWTWTEFLNNDLWVQDFHEINPLYEAIIKYPLSAREVADFFIWMDNVYKIILQNQYNVILISERWWSPLQYYIQQRGYMDWIILPRIISIPLWSRVFIDTSNSSGIWTNQKRDLIEKDIINWYLSNWDQICFLDERVSGWTSSKAVLEIDRLLKNKGYQDINIDLLWCVDKDANIATISQKYDDIMNKKYKNLNVIEVYLSMPFIDRPEYLNTICNPRIYSEFNKWSPYYPGELKIINIPAQTFFYNLTYLSRNLWEFSNISYIRESFYTWRSINKTNSWVIWFIYDRLLSIFMDMQKNKNVEKEWFIAVGNRLSNVLIEIHKFDK